MAKALDMLSKSQFSILRRANSHIPAQPVALTQASQAGTSESVKKVRNKNKITDPPNVIASVMYHSDRVENVTVTGRYSFLLTSTTSRIRS